MKRIHYAILIAVVLSYTLMVTFIFADMMFDLTGILRDGGEPLSPSTAMIGACLIGLVGAINVWLTYYYMQKANTMRDWVVVCAWTHRIKSGGRWLSLEDFLAQNLGCQVSHGLSDSAFHTMQDELDSHWRQIKPEVTPAAPPAGFEKKSVDGSEAPAAPIG